MTEEERTHLTPDEILDKLKTHEWGHIKVVCDLHRPMKYPPKSFVECTRPECQAVMQARREAVKTAGGPTEEDTARWRAWYPGQATAKVTFLGITVGGAETR
jgi:hypothetical protein